MACSSVGLSSGWVITSSAIARSSGRQAPSPWIGSWVRAMLAIQPGSSRATRSGSSSRAATLARGCRSGVIEIRTRVSRRVGIRVASSRAVIPPIE